MNRTGKVVTSEVAARLGVSDVTIRADLDALERRGRLTRTHGGAVATTRDSIPAIVSFDSRMSRQHDAKRRIALAAATYLHSNQTVIFDAGTTTHHLAFVMPTVEDLTVYTSGIPIAQQLMTVDGVETHLLGGRVDPQWLSTVGNPREQGIDDLLVHTLFLGGYAIDEDLDIVDVSRNLARNKIQFSRRARTTILMLDSTKWNRPAAIKVMPVCNANIVITDDGISDETKSRLRKLKCELIIV
ncbi:DeoR/GlpR family DNA-binding transcription regulator [Rhodococcus opacus]|nr:DeoR/GlpR family DNA-binding transcription regulator [Rhodococcus opacus]